MSDSTASGIAGITDSAFPDPITGKLERRKPSLFADRVRDDLIDRNAEFDVSSRRLAGPHPGQEGRVRPGMIAAPVPPGRAVFMLKHADDVKILLKFRVGLVSLVELEVCSGPRELPLIHIHPVWLVEEGRPERHSRLRRSKGTNTIAGPKGAGKKGFKGGERNAHAQPSQKVSSIQLHAHGMN